VLGVAIWQGKAGQQFEPIDVQNSSTFINGA
jgi:hypothetical protein